MAKNIHYRKICFIDLTERSFHRRLNETVSGVDKQMCCHSGATVNPGVVKIQRIDMYTI